MLEFCTACDSLLSLEAGEDNVVYQHCARCDTRHDIPRGVHVMWDSLGSGGGEGRFDHLLHADMRGDPTFPTVQMQCPTCVATTTAKYAKCGSSSDVLYCCTACGTFWRRCGRDVKIVTK
jgi:DNA-directed RNA polymerase subunit M/transcription elongation factor TFIIS